jgi:PAS domain S-box-containing protein
MDNQNKEDMSPFCQRRIVDLQKKAAEQEIIEKASRPSDTRYRCLFEAAQDGILILDAVTGQINDVNPFLIKLLGYSKEDFLGKKLWEIGLFKDTNKSKEMFALLKDKEYIRFEDLPLETSNGRRIDVEFVSNVYMVDQEKVIQCIIRDITDRRRIEAEKEVLIHELKSALDNINKLSGFLPICMHCKKIRNDKGYWEQLEAYISEHSEAQFSHALCEDCAKEHYPEFYEKDPGESPTNSTVPAFGPVITFT